MAARRVTKKALSQARQLAMEGRPDEAETALGEYVELGSTAAAASLAELLAFRGDWERMVSNAALLVAEPSAVYAGNVFDDMVRLLALGGHRGVAWETIRRAAIEARARVEREEERPHALRRLTTILSSLVAYAERDGAPPHERIQVFGVHRPVPSEASYRKAVDEVLELRPDLAEDEEALARHRFAMATAFQQAEHAVELFFSAEEAMDFNACVELALILIQRGEAERAWRSVEPKLGRWWPVDHAQVAPVQLVADSVLREMLNAERCEQILATPRGPAAA